MKSTFKLVQQDAVITPSNFQVRAGLKCLEKVSNPIFLE